MKSNKSISLKSPVPQVILLFGFIGFIFSITYLNYTKLGLVFLFVEMMGVYLVLLELQTDKKRFLLAILSLILILTILAGYLLWLAPPEVERIM